MGLTNFILVSADFGGWKGSPNCLQFQGWVQGLQPPITLNFLSAIFVVYVTGSDMFIGYLQCIFACVREVALSEQAKSKLGSGVAWQAQGHPNLTNEGVGHKHALQC